MRPGFCGIVCIGLVGSAAIGAAERLGTNGPQPLLPARSFGQSNDYVISFETPPEKTAKASSSGARILYVNRFGAEYRTAGYDNSSENATIVGAKNPDGSQRSDIGRTFQIPPWDEGDELWYEVMDCIRDSYKDFDIKITEFDPGDKEHTELIIGGAPEDAFQSPFTGGVSPLQAFCSVVTRAAAFVFPEHYKNRGDVAPEELGQWICWAAVHEAGHSFGLEHVYHCPDPMTYLEQCQLPKRFVNDFVECGEYDELAGGFERSNCQCGTSQNSHERLMNQLGARPEDILAPEVSFIFPTEGVTVTRDVRINVFAEDNVEVTRVELSLDGNALEPLERPPYLFQSGDLDMGAHTLEATAIDAAGHESTKRIQFWMDSGGNPNIGGSGLFACRLVSASSSRHNVLIPGLFLLVALVLRRRRSIE